MPTAAKKATPAIPCAKAPASIRPSPIGRPPSAAPADANARSHRDTASLRAAQAARAGHCPPANSLDLRLRSCPRRRMAAGCQRVGPVWRQRQNHGRKLPTKITWYHWRASAPSWKTSTAWACHSPASRALPKTRRVPRADQLQRPGLHAWRVQCRPPQGAGVRA